MSGSAIINGKLCQDVNFVDNPKDADFEVVYDRAEYNKDCNTWMYFYHNYLVATAKNDVSKRAG